MMAGQKAKIPPSSHSSEELSGACRSPTWSSAFFCRRALACTMTATISLGFTVRFTRRRRSSLFSANGWRLPCWACPSRYGRFYTVQHSELRELVWLWTLVNESSKGYYVTGWVFKPTCWMQVTILSPPSALPISGVSPPPPSSSTGIRERCWLHIFEIGRHVKTRIPSSPIIPLLPTINLCKEQKKNYEIVSVWYVPHLSENCEVFENFLSSADMEAL